MPSDSRMVRLICNHQRAYYQVVGQSQLIDVRANGEITWISSGSPSFFNAVLETRSTSDRIDALIEEAIAYFATRDVRRFVWRVEDDDRPDDLRGRLMDHGLREVAVGPLMAVDLHSVEADEGPRSLDVRSVEDRADARAWANIVTSAYGLPRTGSGFHASWLASLSDEPTIRSYIGFAGGKPVSSAQIFLHEAVAALYWVATVPEARRAGHGTRITRVALSDARRGGAEEAILHANAPAVPLYERLGFRDCGSVKRYVFSFPSGDASRASLS